MRPSGAAALAFAAAIAGGCTPADPQIRDAITGINQEFQKQYEKILEEKGARVYRVSRKSAYDALATIMARLNMRIGDKSEELGYLNVFAPAPAPLNAQEWAQAAEVDLPRMRQIAEQHVGMAGRFLTFEPEGLEIVINATVIAIANGTEITLTMRMREFAPPKSGRPRREYAPPAAVRLGLDKIWAELDREFPRARVP